MKIKINVAAVREEKGISLSELSRRCGVAKSTLFYIELGATDPKLGTLCKIAEALGVPTAALFSCAEEG